MVKRQVWAPALVLAALLAGCSSGAGKVAATLDVKAVDTAFEPTSITIQKGETARFVLKNDGAQEHDFSVDNAKGKASVVSESGGHGKSHSKANLHVSAAPGKTGTVDFTPSESGTYEYYCTVPGHKEAGMTGKLIVQ